MNPIDLVAGAIFVVLALLSLFILVACVLQIMMDRKNRAAQIKEAQEREAREFWKGRK